MNKKDLQDRIKFLKEFNEKAEVKIPESILILYQQCIEQIELIKSIAEYNYPDLPEAAIYCKEYLNKINEE